MAHGPLSAGRNASAARQLLVDQQLGFVGRVPCVLFAARGDAWLEASRLVADLRVHAPGAALRLYAIVACDLCSARVLEFFGQLAAGYGNRYGQYGTYQCWIFVGSHFGFH